jgi:putative ABC transport system permease protein
MVNLNILDWRINMYILKNSAKNLKRNFGRNLLMGIIVLTMISSIAISIIINTTTNEVINNYKNRFGSEVQITPDFEKIMANADKSEDGVFDPIKGKQYEDFSKSDYLKETKLTAQFNTFSDKLKGLDQDEEKSNNSGMSASTNGSISNEDFKMPNVNILGYSNNNIPTEFKDGTRTITSGEMFKNANECIVSEDFAELNNLKVGDTIDFIGISSRQESKELDLKISGIYRDLTPERSNGFPKMAMSNRRNEIITSYDTFADYNTLFAENSSPVYISAKYFLKDPDFLEDFTEEVRAKGLSDMYNVSTDEDNYNKIIKPVKGLSKVSLMFMVGILTFGSVILIILSLLSIRERKYEIGVLRAMGMSKLNVAKGFVYESMIIIVLCLSIGLGTGVATAQPVSNILLDEQIKIVEESQNTNNSMSFTMIGDSESTVSSLDKIDINLSSTAIVQIIIIALLLGFITSIIAVFYAMKYEPIKILSERN